MHVEVQMSDRLAGRVAVITGGASGIGWQTAQLFVAEGAKVVIGDRNAALLDQRGSTLGGDSCATAEVDVTQESDLERLVRLAVETFGGLDVAVNCAGFGFLGSVDEHPVDSRRAVLDVCLTGTFLAVKHEAPTMLDQGTGGAIVNISSISGRQVSEGMAACCSAKAGVDMLTRVAAVELGPRGPSSECDRARLCRDAHDRSNARAVPAGVRRCHSSRSCRAACRHRARRALPGRRRGGVGQRGDLRGRRRWGSAGSPAFLERIRVISHYGGGADPHAGRRRYSQGSKSPSNSNALFCTLP
jgi:NAD(P)-dependent dehydrogenase (short-subunit alcohol dehydrogenase family)